MSWKNNLRTVKRLRRGTFGFFIRMYPYLAITFIVFSVTLTLAIGSYELAFSGLRTIGVPVIAAAILLIIRRQVGRYSVTDAFTASHHSDSVLTRLVSQNRITVSVFLILFAVSVLLLTIGQHRPLAYFVVVSLIYAFIVFQILVREFNPRVLLAEIPLVMLNLIYGVTLKYHYYFGWTDIIGHIARAKYTYQAGHTIPSSIAFTYAKFPLYHIFVAEAKHFLGFDITTSLYVVTAIPYAVTAVLVYYFAERGFDDKRVPALATVVYSVNTTVLFYGYYMVTRTMAFVGFVFILYIIAKQTSEDSMSFTLFLVLMTLFTSIVHQVSMPQIVILLSLLYLCKKVVDFRRFLRLRTLVFITLFFISYWLFVAWDFMSTILVLYTRPELYDSTTIESAGSKVSVGFAYEIRYLIHNYVIVFYSILGIGAGLYERHSKYARTILLFSLLILGIFVPSPLHLLEVLMDRLRFDRLMLLVSPFVAVAMGVGIVTLVRQVNVSRRNAIRRVGTVIAVLLVVTYVFTSMTAPLIASDSKDLHWSESRKHFTKAEVKGFQFIFQETDPGVDIRTDFPPKRFFRFYDNLDPDNHPSGLLINVSNIDSQGYVVFREKKFKQSGLILAPPHVDAHPTAKTKAEMHRQFLEKNKIFSNGDVEIYYSNESTDRRFRQATASTFDSYHMAR